MDLDKYARQLKEGKSGAALQKLTESEAGARLVAQVDGEKLAEAARQGDTGTLSAMLRGILSTPEGRNFAAQVEKAVKSDGR